MSSSLTSSLERLPWPSHTSRLRHLTWVVKHLGSSPPITAPTFQPRDTIAVGGADPSLINDRFELRALTGEQPVETRSTCPERQPESAPIRTLEVVRRLGLTGAGHQTANRMTRPTGQRLARQQQARRSAAQSIS